MLPATDDRVRTRVRTAEGWIDFQDYFVRCRCEPAVLDIVFDGAERARPHPDILAALRGPELRAVVICPSNPLISIEPILAVRGMRDALAVCEAPVLAVSPIIGGKAVKGPTAKMMAELGIDVSAAAVARRYADLLDAFIVDLQDAPGPVIPGIKVVPAQTLMHTMADREALARQVLMVADEIGQER